MDPSEIAPPRRLRPAVPLALLALAALAALAWTQSPAASLYGYDGPYHIRYSAWLREHGVQRTFPWWQETFLKDHWADKDFLYHVALVPFTFGDLAAGGKAASLLFGTLLYLSLGIALWRVGVRWPAAWGAACLVGSTTLLYRAGLLRSHVAAIALALLGTASILRGKRWGAALASAAYAWTHIAWHLLPGIAAVHAAACLLLRRGPRWSVLLWSAAGALAAIVASPYFPDNLRLWRVQVLDVLAMSWGGSVPDLGLGKEVLPGSPWLLAWYNPVPLAFTAMGVWMALRAAPWRREARGRSAEEAAALTLGAVSLGLLAMSLLSRRFVEFWAPFSTLFAATAAAAWGVSGRRPRPAVTGNEGRRRARAIAAILSLALIGWHNLAQTRRIISDDPGLIFRRCGEWIRDHVPPGDVVFTTDWDEFPELFFFAPDQRYLVGLDPTFMYVTNPDRWRRWRDTAEARAGSLRRELTETFHATHAFADAGYEAFIERAGQEPGMRLAVADPECRVYAIDPPDDPRIPSRRFVSGWRAEGGGTIDAAPGDFVDLARAGPAPDPAADPTCIEVKGVFPVGGPGTGRLILHSGDDIEVQAPLDAGARRMVRFHLYSDDDIVVRVNDAEAHDTRRPARPPTLDEIVARQNEGGRHPHEHVFEAPARPGYNDVSLSVCRAGTVWGFHLEIEP